jgi:hypothetical protein
MKKRGNNGTMLELWRPPPDAGEPIGCLTTTYTFSPGLFDEQCLGRFLEIDSDPKREELPFILEKVRLLGRVYCGVMVDHSHAGVAHSLRWDLLPVRIPGGKQHAKISLLAWERHVRIIVASANLSEHGYRKNREVVGTIECTPENTDHELLKQAIGFLKRLLRWVPGANTNPPEIERARTYLDRVAKTTRGWNAPPRRKHPVRQHLVFTLPANGPGSPAHSALDECMAFCVKNGGRPTLADIASPFFDKDEGATILVKRLCDALQPIARLVHFFIPSNGDTESDAQPRLAAPKSLWSAAQKYRCACDVSTLPDTDGTDLRPWHAKMLRLRGKYCALMIGSSNFTCAGMGIGTRRNAEANLLTLTANLPRVLSFSELAVIWPDAKNIEDPAQAEWLGARPDDEHQEDAAPQAPAGFLCATYRAGDNRSILVRLDPTRLPESWSIEARGEKVVPLLSSIRWEELEKPASVDIPWHPKQPPDQLTVSWHSHGVEFTAGFPLNVEDSRHLPPPPEMDKMTAEDLLWILSAKDPGRAFRTWAKRIQPAGDEDELDSAVPADLDPLRRYDLQATYLHRIQRRARVLARLRAHLEQPIWGKQALEWRLRGLLGIEPLARRMLHEYQSDSGDPGEGLLALADFLIVLHEVDYRPQEGGLSRAEFERAFRPFLHDLASDLNRGSAERRKDIPRDLQKFWNRVIRRCDGNSP